MEPFTQALGVLQNEEQMSIGCLSPTTKLLEDTMQEFFSMMQQSLIVSHWL